MKTAILNNIKAAWRGHRWYIVVILLLIATNAGAILYHQHQLRASAWPMMRAKNQIWLARTTYTDISDLPGGKAILDTLIPNSLNRASVYLSEIQIPDPAPQ